MILDRTTTDTPLQSAVMRLSQGQLNLLQTCPRQFQHLYLDHLATPIPLEQQRRMLWGSRFHLLMQQRELGLPIEALMAEDPQLQDCLAALVQAAPEILDPDRTIDIDFRQSEHPRTLEMQGYALTVIYDLLVLTPDRAQILDWKTYGRPSPRVGLAQNWQTRLYLFLLAETTDYAPEQISMTYWFVQVKDPKTGTIAPQSLTFAYDAAQHEQTRQDLSVLLQQLTHWLSGYEQGQPFPQVSPTAGACPDCHFAPRCQRESSPAPLPIADPLDLDQIAEVSL